MNQKSKKDYQIADSGKHTEFPTGARRDLQGEKGRFDLLPPQAIRALAIHYEKGCKKYGERNWEKGIPISTFLNSSIRHLFQFLDGKDDENHLISAFWNVACAYETILRIQQGRLPKELYDLPIQIVLPEVYVEEG